MLFVNHFGACCVYVIFIANCLKDFGDYYWEEYDNRIYMLMEIVPLCLIFYIPNLKALVPLVFVANIALIFGKQLNSNSIFLINIVLKYALPSFSIISSRKWRYFRRWPPFRTSIYIPSTLELQCSRLKHQGWLFYLHMWNGVRWYSIKNFMLQIVSIEANMRNPADFRKVCGIFVQAMLIIVFIQIVFAFFGYWRYGEQIASTILQNLPSNAALVDSMKSTYRSI